MRKQVGEVRGSVPAGGETRCTFRATRATSVSAFAATGGLRGDGIGIRSVLVAGEEQLVDTDNPLPTAALFDPRSDLVLHLRRMAPGEELTLTLVNDGAAPAEGTIELWGQVA
jgi:hypothetical protein